VGWPSLVGGSGGSVLLLFYGRWLGWPGPVGGSVLLLFYRWRLRSLTVLWEVAPWVAPFCHCFSGGWLKTVIDITTCTPIDNDFR